MLEPNHRVILTEQLRPPAGYRLESAVATTFTLDLETALVLPLAFASHELRSAKDPIATLEAVRSAAERVDVFGQSGQIIAPQRASDLMAFLEPMLHPVRPPRRGFLFHPKVWFLRFTAEGAEDRYRLLCSTRNLVDSNAWDATLTLEGRMDYLRLDSNLPLTSFLRYLPRLTVTPMDEERAKRVNDLARRARRIIWDAPPDVQDMAFHALGVPHLESNIDFSGSKHLVISPFCNDEGVRHVTGRNRRAMLVSTPEALDSLSPEVVDRLRPSGADTLFTLDPSVRQDLAPEDDEDRTPGPELPELYGLHAKITILERNRGETHVFVGSANATSAAYNGNVEFLVELIGRKKFLGVDTLMKATEEGDASTLSFRDLLHPYRCNPDAAEAPSDEDLRRLQNQLRKLAAVPCEIHVSGDEDGYTLHLTSDGPADLPANHELTFELLTRPGFPQIHPTSAPVNSRFGGVPLPDITPFVVLRLKGPRDLKLSTVIHAALHNDPPGRMSAILRRQVDTPEKFLRLIALILGVDVPDEGSDTAESTGITTASSSQVFGSQGGIFEQVINALVDRKDTLLDLDELVKDLRTDEENRVIPEGFEAFWAEVMDAVGALREES